MLKACLSALALAGALNLAMVEAAQYADAVVAYNPGVLPATVSSYTNANAALGEPARATPGQFGGPVDPFDPPYLDSQLTALSTNGSLTVHFAQPIKPDRLHPYGLDFIVFANSGFVITNANYTGGGITDGSLFGNNGTSVRVSVSADNVTYYVLSAPPGQPLSAPFPTDGTGDFSVPVSPTLSTTNFAGLGLPGIRQFYGGSGGGAGFSISWAQNSSGQAVALASVSYIRVEVFGGHLEIDGFAAVAPQPGFYEDFAGDPSAHGWQVLGEAALFRWNATNHNLEVTWDSSKPNSYFARALGRTLDKRDDLGLEFDLQLQNVKAGVNPAKAFAFELAVGFLNQAGATGPTFFRGTGTGSPNLVEWDYFPDTGFGATISTAIVSSNNQFIPSFSFPLELTPSNLFHVTLKYTAASQTLATTMTRNGAPFGPIKAVNLGTNFTDFLVDTVAISSYSDTNADGSILAHGTIDNLLVTLPQPPLSNLTGQFGGGSWQVSFHSQPNWLYTLERTTDLGIWTPLSAATLSQTYSLRLLDTNSPAGRAFYRVTARRP